MGSTRRVARLVGTLLCAAGAAAWWTRSGLLPLGLDVLYQMTLPVLALVLIGFASPMLVMRDLMLDCCSLATRRCGTDAHPQLVEAARGHAVACYEART